MQAPGNSLTGQRLALGAYHHDFESRMWRSEERDSWKLERQQSFQEDGSPSWDAFMRGDWDDALRLIGERRESLAEYYGRAASTGLTFYRVRVVAEPITPYLQWELNSLRQRGECGEQFEW
ncbi:MAG TPA: hypothetical protein VFG87_21370 [Amycolatopsis sp.]|jgi:hypothetical protein|nr:hypothetical protein [Amycolatopsis sp.]